MKVTRRNLLTALPAALATTTVLNHLVISQAADEASTPDVTPPKEPFRYCLNTATIRGQEVGIVREVEIAAEAGYHAIEPWIGGIEKYVKDGGVLADLKKKISDSGLQVVSAIGFANWIVDDKDARAKGLEQARRDMDLLVQIGGQRIAAPPAGATNEALTNLNVIAERYRTLCDLGHNIGIVPQLEVWGFSKTLSRLAETMYVVIESRHPDACALPDVYHLHKGGSGMEGLRVLSGQGIHVFHVNDYPATPDREKINDADRIYPGDGVAPNDWIYQTLYQNGFRGFVSLELFNREYWKQDPLAVAKTGLQKTKETIIKSMESQMAAKR